MAHIGITRILTYEINKQEHACNLQTIDTFYENDIKVNRK